MNNDYKKNIIKMIDLFIKIDKILKLFAMELLSTLGPSSLNEQTLKKLDLLGVSMFRINLSHTEIEDLEKGN